MAYPLPNPQNQFFDSSGSPLSSGTIEFRNPSTDVLIDTYPTADDADAQTNANSNPLTLNSRGEAATGIYLREGVDYKIILKDSAGSTIWTQDDVSILSSNVPLKDTANTFTASQTISHATGGGLTVTEVDTGATWNFFVSANVLRIQRTDGGTGNAILVSGDGAGTITSIAMAATNITANGTEVLTHDPVAAVTDLNQTISASYSQAEVQAISDKVDALLAAMRTGNVLAT